MDNMTLQEAIEAVVDARFQFGMTPEILENRAKRVAQIAQQEVYDAIRQAVEGFGDGYVFRADILAAIALHDPNRPVEVDALARAVQGGTDGE